MAKLVRATPTAALILLLGCGPLWSCRNCDKARNYMVLAWRVNGELDVPLAFKAVGRDVPGDVRTPLDAKIYFARKAVDCRCEENTHAETYLGSLLVERGELPSGIDHLERGLARSPIPDGYVALATAYELAGDLHASATARRRADELRGAWDLATQPPAPQ